MTNLNVKTNPARKGKTIAGAVMTLTAAAVVAMAPMSQAFALGYLMDTGAGTTDALAKKDAKNKALNQCKNWGKTKVINATWVPLPKDAKYRYVRLHFDCA